MKNKNILVIDDSETIRILLTAILEDEVSNITVANSVKNAEILLKEYNPDLILLDLLILNKNGFDLLKKLKVHNTHHQIPIIIVAAFANTENKIMAKEMGAVDIIEKPISISNFLEKVYNALLTYEYT